MDADDKRYYLGDRKPVQLYRFRVRTTDGREAISEATIVIPEAPPTNGATNGASLLAEKPLAKKKTAAKSRYLDVAEMLKNIADEAEQRPLDFKLAITFTGGGARGAYEAGVAEGLMQQLRKFNQGRKQPLQASILGGTSAGAIVAFALFTDVCYPKRDGDQRFIGRQAELWRQICSGNEGAAKLFDHSWVIDAMTGKVWSPLEVEDEIKDLKARFDKLKTDFGNLRSTLTQLGTISPAPGAAPTHGHATFASQEPLSLAADANASAGAVKSSFANLQSSWSTLDHSIGNLPDSLGDLLEDAGGMVGSLRDGIAAIATAVETVAEACAKLAGGKLQEVFQDVGKLAKDAIDAGNDLAVTIERAGKGLEDNWDHLLELLGIVADAFARKGYAINPQGLQKKLGEFLLQATHGARMPVEAGGNLEISILQDWQARKTLPELFLTGTNLSAQREAVFAVAGEATLGTLAKQGYCVVDLHARAPGMPGIFSPEDKAARMVQAVMTSAAIPGALPPRTWKMKGIWRNPSPLPDGQQEGLVADSTPRSFTHVMVDGGVIDNSPVAIAQAAGATHVISVELDPLTLWVTPPTADEASVCILKTLFSSFDTAMTSATSKSIVQAVRDGSAHVYRLAPLRTRDASINTFNFDGLWKDGALTMSLYDWFMQGYVDANPGQDEIVKEYRSGACGVAGNKHNLDARQNKVWDAVDQALPIKPP